MVWEYQVTTIVMLTRCIENSKVCPPNKKIIYTCILMCIVCFQKQLAFIILLI